MRYTIRPQSNPKPRLPKSNYVDVYADVAHVPHLTVFEEEWQDTFERAFTGLFDADGNPIFCELDRQEFLGFLDPNRPTVTCPS